MRERFPLIVSSFLPYASRFLFRHPTKFWLLRQHWRNYLNRPRCLSELTSKDLQTIEALFYELECENIGFSLPTGWAIDPIHPAIYYVLVRLLQPEMVVETGVCEGNSSRFLLLAMKKNQRGLLHSIDLPNADFELGPGIGRQTHVHHPGKEAGWMVPEELRHRWHLHLGDARELLPMVIASLPPIDVFIHDSLHSYDHMMFEFRTAWPQLRDGGILLSDDTDWNSAFAEFAAQMQCRPIFFNYRVGAIRKLDAAAEKL